MKKLLSVVLSLAMLFHPSAIALAAEFEDHQIVEKDGNISVGVSDLTVEVVEAPAILIATLPVEIPIIVDTRGDVTVPTDAKIINNSDRNIKVTKIEITSPGSSSILFYGGYSRIGPPDLVRNSGDKALGISLRGDTYNDINLLTNTLNNGVLPLTNGNWNIESNGELPLNIEASASKSLRNTTAAKNHALSVSFTIALTD